MRRVISTATAVFSVASLLLGSAVHAGSTSVFNPGLGYTNLEFVPVGNAGNAPDQLHTDNNPDGLRFGSVPYDYEIGKYEVTNAQYVEFLRAVALESDTHGLYNSNMAGTYGGITRTGESGPFTYTLKDGMGDRPVNYVSWYDTLRFANYLTTGGTEAGVYQFDQNGDLTGILTRAEALAHGVAYLLPTENEWYKAAYHKNDGVTANYWEYPFDYESLTAVTDDTIDTDMANYAYDVGTTSDVGSYEGYASPYGTFDQGGNVWEWNETVIGSSDQYRVGRGGAFNQIPGELLLRASGRGYNYPSFEDIYLGFRVARVTPEPGGLGALVGMAAVGFLWFWRRR